MKHANLSENVGANQNELYPNITLNEDVSLLDLSVQGTRIDFETSIIYYRLFSP